MKGAAGVKGKQARLITSNASGKYIYVLIHFAQTNVQTRSDKQYGRMRKRIQNHVNSQSNMQALALTTKKLIVSTHRNPWFLSSVASE